MLRERTVQIVVSIVVAAALAAAASPARASLYAVTDAGRAFQSLDNGVTWTVKGEIPEAEVVSLSPGLTSGTLFALGRTGSLYRSTNSGAAWSVMGNAGASDCVSLAVARSGALVALTTSGDVSRSTNAGATWTRESTVQASDCVALAVGGYYSGPNDTLYVATRSGDISRYPGFGSWSVVGSTAFTPVVDLLWLPGILGRLYVLSDAGEVLRSTNDGVTWTVLGGLSQVGMRDLSYVGGKFKAMSREGEVYESTDAATWSASWVGATNQVFTVAAAPGVPEFLTGIESVSPGAGPIALRAYPNPFTDRVAFRVSGADQRPTGATAAPIEVFDTSGRLVARLPVLELDRPGASIATWDGRAFGSVPAAAGSYFARLDWGGTSVTAHLVLLR